MDKLKRYNQKLLAIIGTLILLGLATLIIIGIFTILSYLFKSNINNNIRDNSLTINAEKDTINVNENKLKQDVSFQNPRLIDTVKTIYLIPITQVNIENKTNGSFEEIALTSGSGSRDYYKSKSYVRYSGEFNNILIYNEQKNTKNYVFSKKIYITDFSNWVINSKQYLLITGAYFDTNKDNKLNEDDLTGLFVYDIETKKLFDYNLKGLEFVNFYKLNEVNKFFVRYAIDKNNNGEINYYQEPIIVKVLNFDNMKMYDFVSKKEIDKLNKLIN